MDWRWRLSYLNDGEWAHSKTNKFEEFTQTKQGEDNADNRIRRLGGVRSLGKACTVQYIGGEDGK